MAYTALYRKYRPKTFGGVVGQDHIVRTLANQIKAGRISHAYLFCGTRGTGKTSVAKIFARALNCEETIDGEPCGECGFCTISNDQAAMVIYEIDAASNNGVDNIRDIIETVKYPPAMGKYKVYIIDEVHMLSSGAFNALLKTLEEPPEHVVFVLATTEPHKIPPTIHSRCQRFDFRRISSNEMAERLREYMDKEGTYVDDAALSYISRVSDGAMRDALSILDQCLSFFYGEHITLEMVLDVLGSVSSDVLFNIIDAIYNKDPVGCMRIIDEAVSGGKDIVHFAAEIVEHLRNLLVAAAVGEYSNSLDFSAENLGEIRRQSSHINKEVLLEYIDVFSDLQSKIKYATNERVLLEVTCLRLCNQAKIAAPNIPADILQRMERIEAKIKNSASPAKLEQTLKPHENAPKPTPEIKKAVPDEIKNAIDTWKDFLGFLKSEKEMVIYGFLSQTTPCYLDNNILTIACDNLITAEHLKKSSEMISDILAKKYGRRFDVKFCEKSEHNSQHEKKYGVKDDAFESFSNKLNWQT